MAEHHLPNDEYIDQKPCKTKEFHDDHYWFDGDVEFYCPGK
jgi:hypothetical protein